MLRIAGFAAFTVLSLAALGGLAVHVPAPHPGAVSVRADGGGGAGGDQGTPGPPVPPPGPTYTPDTWGWGG
ncbi:hypothetical protein [Streptomyces sp. HPF1205]|uniref:hypothetical protein n=1 Tax=Streptomyces sp. HPF1205 TaxID=2873262 RepID=UPI001CED600D|nr:hypothetical protein [Streptomyces sp. HPF1205]